MRSRAANLCSKLFELKQQNYKDFVSNWGLRFFQPGLGVVKNSAGDTKVQIKLSKEDCSEGRPLRKMAAQILNYVLSPITALTGANKLTQVIRRFEAGLIVIFPSGRNADLVTNDPWQSVDTAWKQGLYDFINEVPQTTLVPFFVEDTLSDVFYNLKSVAPPLHLAVVPGEFVKKANQPINMYVGEAISSQTVLETTHKYSLESGVSQKVAALGYLRSLVFNLAKDLEVLDAPASASTLFFEQESLR